MSKKRFDCVEMKRKGSLYVHKLISGMTEDEEIAFWHERTARLLERQAELIKDKEKTAKASAVRTEL